MVRKGAFSRSIEMIYSGHKEEYYHVIISALGEAQENGSFTVSNGNTFVSILGYVKNF